MKHITLVLSLAIAMTMISAPVNAVPRSYSAKAEFARRVACPATNKHTVSCKGYVIDHKKALDCGGKDQWQNMQWQTVAAAKAKDKIERDGPECKHQTHGA